MGTHIHRCVNTDTHIHTDTCTFATNTCRHTHVHTLIQEYVERHTQSRLHALNTHVRAHIQTQMQAHAHTHTYVYIPDTHLSRMHKYTLRHGAPPHTKLCRLTRLHRHTCVPMLTWARSCGCRPMPAHSLQYSLQTPLPGRAPTLPIHLSVDCGQQAGLEPGSGGWASGGITWRWHQAGERLDDLGRLGREGPALPQDEALINLMN